MIKTLAVVLPLLSYAASTIGAGALAFVVFGWLRSRFPQPSMLPVQLIQRCFYLALYAPRYARISAFVLAAGISIVASLLVAFLSNTAIVPTLDDALSAAIAALVSQITHAALLSADMPYQRRARIYEVQNG